MTSAPPGVGGAADVRNEDLTGPGVPVRRGPGLDPRTKVLLLVTVSVAVMAPGGRHLVPAALLLGVLLAVAECAWVRALLLPLVAAVFAALAFGLPPAFPYLLTATAGIVAAYALRLTVIVGVAAHLLGTTRPAELTAGLRALRIPRAITVSGAVMLRFIPTVGAEARAVRDAMRLRGVGGWSDLLRHPVACIEYFVVPLIASTLRVAEDLSAAALLRGLGSHIRPTSMHPPRLGVPDAVVVLTAVALAAVTLGWETTR